MSTPSSVRTDSATLDLLQFVAVRVPCAACRQPYEVSLRQVLLSQDLLHDGCTVAADTECLPLTYASLANEDALRAFEHSWSRLLEVVRRTGFDLTVCRPILSH